MANFLQQRKASKVGKVVGNLFNISAQMGIPLTVVNTIMLIVTTSTALQNRGVEVTAWQMGLAIILVIVVVGIAIWKFIMPNYYSVWAEQFYKHGNNPMNEDIKKIKEKLGIKDE